MSNLRIIGLIVGLVSLYLTLRIYRGAKWKRKNFFLWGTFSVFCIAISVNPNFMNTLTGMLALQSAQRGRLIALLIFSNFFLWFLFLHVKSKLDSSLYQFDLLVRRLSYEEAVIFEKELEGVEIAVIMPAYNEAENLRNLLKNIPYQIQGKNVRAIVIDDGSEDNSREVVEKSGHLYVRNKINRGQGAASRLGYDILVYNNIHYGVTLDSDGQHLAEDIERVISPVLEKKCDLAIGSRVLGKGFKNSILRSVGIFIFTKFISFITRVKLTDCSSGFKAFDINEIRKLNLRQDQFQSAEVIIDAAKKGLKIKEVPITISKRSHGESKKGKDLSYGLNFSKTIFKTWLRK